MARARLGALIQVDVPVLLQYLIYKEPCRRELAVYIRGDDKAPCGHQLSPAPKHLVASVGRCLAV
jgi:hypothetical protein